ncbi:purine-nucleoside phosphorylase [Corynebacterium guangdongense]|uniref:Uridine phosphorylase n=1 Tax=Corynebacterium guangdongense TaxID=1783348 RepID=A0ABU1ZXG5_9CORY|nr:purine-nucleoside phosphorylase [Corynebacterium guangdongense]MDR7329633.1 purine-nucleoside phosphorylase [Corynebacterium guangdongense]WJZ18198.1 Purine nucleoside phosphorylase DeoD-type [Corynebacterium guangdongense]
MPATTASTPHISPNGAPIAETVLLPGDPLRAKFIAEHYLEDVVQFNGVRNMLGYTGTYRGTEVSVMGSGMGIPSVSLYAYELIHTFGAKKLVRVGSCGSMREDIGLYEIVVAQAACTDSNFLAQYDIPGTFAPIASWRLLQALVDDADARGVRTHVGNILSTDAFHNVDRMAVDRWARMGVLGAEMESAGLYAVAAHAGVEALGLFTVSDNIITGEQTTPAERESAFTRMIELALPLAAL